MDWITGIQRAVDYIEAHILDDLDCSEIAHQAACSPFYFQRIFGLLCGMPLSEYIRNRRLTLAGSELSSTDIRVIDAALKYGYDSPESFARAFQRFHGITPSEAKRGGTLKSFSRVSVQITLKGGSIMDYKIVKKDAFKVLERVEPQNFDDFNESENPAVDLWNRSFEDGTVDILLDQSPEKVILYGITYGNTLTESAEFFDNSIAALYGGGEIPEGLRVNEIPECTWAVFECSNEPSEIEKTWLWIYNEFFSATGYHLSFEIQLDVYTKKSNTFEIWVPVEAK